MAQAVASARVPSGDAPPTISRMIDEAAFYADGSLKAGKISAEEAERLRVRQDHPFYQRLRTAAAEAAARRTRARQARAGAAQQ